MRQNTTIKAPRRQRRLKRFDLTLQPTSRLFSRTNLSKKSIASLSPKHFFSAYTQDLAQDLKTRAQSMSSTEGPLVGRVPPTPGYSDTSASARAVALKFAKRPVDAASVVSSSHYYDNGYSMNRLVFKTLLKHNGSQCNKRIDVTVCAVLGKVDGMENTDPKESDILLDFTKPLAAYLVGGPGSDNPATAHTAMNDFYLAKGFQILYMDYRGMGGSHELRFDDLNVVFTDGVKVESERRLAHLGSDEQIADYLTYFRQDNIVRDLEAIRLFLAEQAVKEGRKSLKLTLVGQSYGGWLSFTYLSFYPESLDMVIVTGGVPPIGQSAETVYKHTFEATLRANDRFYAADPSRIDLARKVVEWVEANTTNGKTIPMPGGGYLTKERFFCLGRTLGTTDGDLKVAASLKACYREICENNCLSDNTLKDIEKWFRFEERLLYCVLQEVIYTEVGLPPADWAAEKVGKAIPEYAWLNDGKLPDGRITFYAEHVFKFHYEQFKSLHGLKGATDILASKTDWEPLFDMDQLAANKVPIASFGYWKDIFIDARLSQVTADATANIVHDVSDTYMHTAVKDKSDEVLPHVWGLLCDAVADSCRKDRAVVRKESSQSAAALLSVLNKQ